MAASTRQLVRKLLVAGRDRDSRRSSQQLLRSCASYHHRTHFDHEVLCTSFLHCRSSTVDDQESGNHHNASNESTKCHRIPSVGSRDVAMAVHPCCHPFSVSERARTCTPPWMLSPGRNSRFSAQTHGIALSFVQNNLQVRFSSTAAAGERLEDDIASLGNDSNAEASHESGTSAIFCEDLGVPPVDTIQKGSEVAAVIGDCSYPTAFLQLLIEKVHLSGGLPWWASIVATTIGIRLLVVPIIVHQIRSTAKLSLMRPEMEKINAEIKDSNFDPIVTADAQRRIKELFTRYNTSPFAPFIGGLLQAPIFICFFFAVRNMAERVESFKYGGFLWFTDLSTADTTYILPLLTSLSLLANVELNAMEGLEGNPMAKKMKTFFRLFAALTFPLTLSFEKAIFFYWIPSNLWTFFQAAVMKRPAVKSYFGIPSTAHLSQESKSGVELTAKLAEPVAEPAERNAGPEKRVPRPSQRKTPHRGYKRR